MSDDFQTNAGKNLFSTGGAMDPCFRQAVSASPWIDARILCAGWQRRRERFGNLIDRVTFPLARWKLFEPWDGFTLQTTRDICAFVYPDPERPTYISFLIITQSSDNCMVPLAGEIDLDRAANIGSENIHPCANEASLVYSGLSYARMIGFYAALAQCENFTYTRHRSEAGKSRFIPTIDHEGVGLMPLSAHDIAAGDFVETPKGVYFSVPRGRFHLISEN